MLAPFRCELLDVDLEQRREGSDVFRQRFRLTVEDGSDPDLIAPDFVRDRLEAEVLLAGECE